VTRDHQTSVDTPVAPVAVPASGVLSAWSTHDWRGGVQVDELSALDRLIVRTENSTYEIVLLSPAGATILVRGGAFFPVFTPARLAGCSLGGSFLKLRSVHVGFRMELSTENGFIITSSVRTVAIAPAVTNPNDIM
jgi:hypothetical protein